MKTIVIYKSKYGATRVYAQWIGEELSCPVIDAKSVKPADLKAFDTIIYGGGLYAEVIAGVTLITKNFNILKDKKIIIYTTGLTPPQIRDYYDKIVPEKNFKNGLPDNVRVFNFSGKMIMEELSLPHKAAIYMLKKIMVKKENPTEMERLLIDLCDSNGDFTDRSQITELLEYARKQGE